MIAELGRLQPERLSVIARTSVMRYKDSAEPASAIGHELGVDYVLEGSVLREGDVIRVIPRLIDARNDTRVWDAPFERRLSGVLALQRDVARGIADSLALALLPEEATRLATAREIDPDAYDEYLKGRSLWYRITPRDSDAALAHFERALERAPDSALMHAWLAIAHASRAQLSVVRTVDAYAAAKPAAEKALSLDPGLPEAHFAAAIVHTWEEWDWAAAEREFEKALALNASYADARAAYSHYLTIVGRSAESAEQIERAMALDPFNPLHRSFYAIVLAAARRTDEAVAIAREVLQTVPNNPVANTALTESLRLLGRSDEELAQWRGYFAQVGDAEMEVALERGAAAGGYTAAAREAAALLDARSRVTDVPPVFVAGWHLRAGDTDGALAWLERALEARDQNLPYVNSVQLWNPLRDDPRFAGLLRRMNLTPR
jgi:Tfp pilus assembly protein PilF